MKKLLILVFMVLTIDSFAQTTRKEIDSLDKSLDSIFYAYRKIEDSISWLNQGIHLKNLRDSAVKYTELSRKELLTGNIGSTINLIHEADRYIQELKKYYEAYKKN